MRGILAGIVLIGVLAGCGGAAWPKTAGETTCGEWSSQMTSEQRDVLGTAMLLALRANDGGTGSPADSVIKAWLTALGDTCKQNPDAKISTVAATLYNLSKDLQP
jgi:hypothetical protein